MYDVGIIGAGPAGYVAALRCAQLGGSVILFEKENVGGVCLNKGCIPTKTLLGSIELVSSIRKAANYGIDVGSVSLNFAKMTERKKEVILKLRQGVAYLLSARKVTLLQKEAKLLSPTQIEAAGERIECKNIIIASGSRPALVPGIEFDGAGIISSDELIEISSVPESLIIVGGGVIGCEFANIFCELGAKVTIVEMMPQLLPAEDREIAKNLEAALRKKGVDIFTKTKITGVQKEDGQYRALIGEGLSVSASKILVATGRRPNLEGVGLEGAGVLFERKFIKVDSQLRTNLANVYAAGDVVGGYMLAHVASYEAIIASENIFGQSRSADYRFVPNCIYTDPEIASVGINEDKAKGENLAYNVAKFPFRALGKAHAIGKEEGFVKLIVDKEGQKILGCQIIGPHASDLIAEVTLACRCAITPKELMETIHAHPTLSEAVAEAAHKASGSPVHMI